MGAAMYSIVTKNMVNCSIDPFYDSVYEGEYLYTAIVPNAGYTLDTASVAVYMGKDDITKGVFNSSTGEIVIEGEGIIGDINIFATAVQSAQQYHVYYSGNGGSTSIADTNDYEDMTEFTVIFTPTPTRSGYAFLGWAYSSSATVPDFTVNGTTTATIAQQDVFLYAVWQLVSRIYRLTLNKSDGSTEDIPLQIPDADGTYSVDFNLSNGQQIHAGNIVIDGTYRKYHLAFGMSDGSSISVGDITVGSSPAESQMFQLNVERYTTDTYVGDTTYTDDSFVGFSVSTDARGCTVYYGEDSKTVPANSTDYVVRFGKYMGVDDGSIESGVMGFSDGFTQIKSYSFSYSKSSTTYCKCLKSIKKWWTAEHIYNSSGWLLQRQGTSYDDNIGDVEIPAFITEFGNASQSQQPFYYTYMDKFRLLGNLCTYCNVGGYCNELVGDANFIATVNAGGTAYFNLSANVAKYYAQNTTYALPLGKISTDFMYQVQNLYRDTFWQHDAMTGQNIYYTGYIDLRYSPIPPTIQGGIYESEGSTATIFDQVAGIYVPAAALSTYQNDSVWSAVTDKLIGV